MKKLIIEILIGFVISLVILYFIFVYPERQHLRAPRIAVTKSNMEFINHIIQQYYQEENKIPASLDADLIRRYTQEGIDISKILNDAWGTPFSYTYPGKDGLEYKIVSYGPDRKPGTSDDIISKKILTNQSTEPDSAASAAQSGR